MDRAELYRKKDGISSVKINGMVEKIYKLMYENEVTLIEARNILAKLGRVIDDAEKRSPNTPLSEISISHQFQNSL